MWKMLIHVLLRTRKGELYMTHLTLLWTNEILKGNVTNINDVPKMLRTKVIAKLLEYGVTTDENGNFIEVVE